MSEIIIYQGNDNSTQLEVQFDNDTFWLTQKQMAELFQRDRTVITKHLNKIFKTEELDEKSNVQILHIANSDKPVTFYNLDAILSVGYRVNSQRGTQGSQLKTKQLCKKETYRYTKQIQELKFRLIFKMKRFG